MSERDGSLVSRLLDDGRELTVYPQIFTTRLCIGDPELNVYDDAWCYHHPFDALVAAAEWDGEGDPPGPWHRHIGSGRRREYDSNGEVLREYVQR